MLVPSALLLAAVGTGGWFSFKYAWWRPAVDWKRPRVLMYHMVSPHRPGARFNKLRVRPERFEEQLKWLRDHNFHFVFASRLFTGEPLPERTVCLTFDDGYTDNLTAADPLLARYGGCATLYLVTDRSGGWSSKKKAHHADDELAAEPKLSDDEVKTLVESGRWEIGGHTRTHANLTALEKSAAGAEIRAGNADLEAVYGIRPATFAYPFGNWNADHPSLLRECGYVGAVTTELAIAPHPYAEPMQVPRVKVSGDDTLFGFRMRMRGASRGLLK
ncbi:polysaccharide deacetylase family protein [Planctomicrobium sp. SH661]|uniref:polysaccharide deacetylase family protein n=1 Tax=Planctomicrobium sp. SH661 TaxID=3448124 RepID=UPI003F5BF095